MRIIILVRILATQGRPKLAAAEALELSKLGHDVELVFLRKSEKMSGYSDILSGVKHKILTNHNDSPLVPLYDYITGLFMPDRKGDLRIDYNLIRKFPGYVGKIRPDLLICHDQFAGLAGYYAYRKFGTKYCVYIDERLSRFKGVLGFMANRYERKVVRHAVRVFAITPKVSDSIKDKHGVNAAVNFQGFGYPDFVDYEQKKNLLISVTAWDSGRRPQIYLDIIKSLPDYKLLMVGNWRSAALREEFLATAKTMDVENRVEVISGVDELTLSNLYNMSKFSVRFGFGEYGSPSGLTEAMRHGLPVIVNEDLGLSDLIREAESGLVIDRISAKTIAEWIDSVDNRREYTHLQMNSILLAKKYTWETHARKFILD